MGLHRRILQFRVWRMPLVVVGSLMSVWAEPGLATATGQGLTTLKVAVHVHSTVSTGTFSPAKILELAARTGVDAVLFTDSVRRHWEYGFWPMRYAIDEPSVLQFGAERYLDLLRQVQRQTPAVLAIPGLEAAPFYYWRRPPLFDTQGGQIAAWDQHVLIFGLRDATAIERLPLAEYDPYHGNQGAAPYQRLIDVVARSGGMTFWAHPMTGHTGRHGRIAEATDPYPHLLELSTGYDGFALTYVGYLSLVDPGALWDQLLTAYCEGSRVRPTWIVGELDWRGPARPLDAVLTQVLVRERSPAAVIEALGSGRSWVIFRTGAHGLALQAFTIADVLSSHEAQVGGRLTAKGAVRIHVACDRPPSQYPATIKLIRDGAVSQTASVQESHVELDWTDERPPSRGFYRVIVEDPSGLIYSNPIFVDPAS